MHISLIILTPIIICLWIYFLIIVTENLFQNPVKSLQPKIINTNDLISNVGVKEKGAKSNRTKTTSYTKNKKNIHIPKFMLDLYEKNRKVGKNLQKSDVVKSVIPTHAGEFAFFKTVSSMRTLSSQLNCGSKFVCTNIEHNFPCNSIPFHNFSVS